MPVEGDGGPKVADPDRKLILATSLLFDSCLQNSRVEGFGLSLAARMPSNLGIERAPFLVLGNFIRNLGLEKGKKGPLKGLVGFRLRALGLRV